VVTFATARRPGDPDSGEIPGALTGQRLWLTLLRNRLASVERATAAEWAAVADEATRHHLRGLTYRRLADSPLAPQVPRDVLEGLRSFYVATATRNALHFRQTSQIVKDLGRREIPVLLLKGIHLARFVYAEPGLRSMHDVDLMVPRERLAEAEQVFLGQGFGPLPRPDLAARCTWSNHLAKLEKTGAPVVELHWSIERPTSPFRVNLDALWDRSRSATLDGAPVRLLCPEDLLLHLALHLSYHHRFERAALKGLVDLASVVAAHGEELDWDALVDRARSWGASGYLYTSLRLTEMILSAPIPARVLAALPHSAADEAIVPVAERYILSLRAALPAVYLELARSGSPGNWLRRLASAVLLPRARMEELYGLRPGTARVYPYYFLRLIGLIRKRGVLLLHALLGTRTMQRTLDHDQDRHRLEQWSPAPPS
jgi:hypothetical protein